MKTKKFGRVAGLPSYKSGVGLSRHEVPYMKEACGHRNGDWWRKNEFGDNRINGDDKDDPSDEHRNKKNFPGDGKFKWIKGEEKRDGYVYGVKRSWFKDEYDYEADYTAGPKDLEWLAKKDANYLQRLLEKGCLRIYEPAVWYLREKRGGWWVDVGRFWQDLLVECHYYDREGDAEIQAVLKQAGEDEKAHGQELLEKNARQKAAEEQKREEDRKEKERQRQEQLRREQEERVRQERVRKEQQERALQEKQREEQERQIKLKAEQEKQRLEEGKRRVAEARKEEIVKLEAELKEREEIERLEQLRQQLEEKKTPKPFTPPVFLKPATPPALPRSAAVLAAEEKKKDEKKFDAVLSAQYQIQFSALRLGKELGHGSFGVVHSGIFNDGKCAVKVLMLPKMTEKEEAEFKNEVALMARPPHHANIVQLFGYCVQPYAIVMELMPEGTLGDLIRSGCDISWQQRYTIAGDITAGLKHLHGNGIVHRDLKSLNVLLRKEGDTFCAKLTDFGLASVKDLTKSTTKVEGSMGTPAWMAPEIFIVPPKYSKKSDIYAYGMVMWEIGAKSMPYKGAAYEQIKDHVLGKDRVCDCYVVSALPDEDQLDSLRAAYIFTPNGLFYFNRSTTSQIVIALDALEALKKELKLTPEDVDKPPRELSKAEQALITTRTNHTQGRETIPLECQREQPSFALLIGNCWKHRAAERPTIEQAAELLQRARSEYEAKAAAPAMLSYEGNFGSQVAITKSHKS